jgi:ribulose-5-phosphate 4-epimerase/fuculose-1-phosphate aldolase
MTLVPALAGDGPRHIGYPIHTEIMAARPDVGAAVMTAVLLDRACRTQLDAMAAGPLSAWGDEADTTAKRAEVWSPGQPRAGWDYPLRTAR